MAAKQLSFVLILLTLVNFASAFQQGGKDQDASFSVHALSSDRGLEDSIIDNALPDSLKQSMQLVKSVKELPTCPRMAAAALMHSCSSLDGTLSRDRADRHPGSNLFVQEESNVYAARLALCELTSAKVTIPPACKPFVPSERAKKERSFTGYLFKNGASKPMSLFQHYDDITKENLDDCMSSLSSTPQSWTSFSNSKQNAATICHATRADIEKDEQIHMHEALNSAIGGASEAVNEMPGKVQEAFEVLKGKMKQFQVDLYDEEAGRREAVDSLWYSFKTRLENGMEAISQKLAKANGDMEEASRSGMQHLSRAYGEGATKLSELAHSTSETTENVEYINSLFRHEIAQHLVAATNDLNLVNHLAPTIYQILMQSNMELANYAQTLEDHRREEERMHQQRMREGFDLQALTNRTRESMELIDEHLHGMMQIFTDIQEYGWTGLLPHLQSLASVLFWMIVSTFFSFGLIHHFCGLSILSSVVMSVAVGLVAAYVLTTSALVRFWEEWTDLLTAQQQYAALTMLVVISAVIVAFRLRSRLRRSQLYDPFEAPYLPKSDTAYY